MSPVYRATVDRVTVCGDDVVLRLVDMEDHAPTFTATIKLPVSSSSALSAHRWWQALASIWGEAKGRSEAGAKVDLDAFLGRRVRVLRLKAGAAGEEYTGWDFEPQREFDVKTKTTLSGLVGKIRRVFGRK